ncbi:hypothetical protein Salmuc_04576 [Salipiger mucosus DSM 16094]|uniref:Uncharacterized protein n=1 Tax=Salipiger mucosus DSM 16094 TaxID=1123237 RepID=S9Q7U0_9RHOB|nr:hypothetical protein Salmuc_04576 [Salipiger mucosus DSM 16094]
MYIGAFVLVVALGCVAEFFESRAENKRSKRNKAQYDFPGLVD